MKINNINTINDAKDFISNSFKKAGIDVVGNNISHINSDDLMNAYVFSSLGFNEEKSSIQNQAIISNLNLNMNKYYEIINKDEVINPAKPNFDVEATSKKIAEYVISNSDNDLDKLYQGRIGVINSFNEARKLIGSSKALEDTLNKTIDLINDEIIKLGGNIVDFKV